MDKILVLFPPTTKHLGLLNDLKERKDVCLIEVGYKETNFIGAFVRKLYLSKKVNKIIKLPNKGIWYRDISSKCLASDINSVLIIDGALNYIDEDTLLSIRQSRKDLKFYLLMINALNADSPSINWIKEFVFTFPWDKILTFDPVDACNYEMTYNGFCYYSAHSIPNSLGKSTDIYFVGGLKGGRKQLILETYQYLFDKHVKCNFQLMVYEKSIPVSKPGLTFHPLGWRPYEEILKDIDHTKCILEILQDGQSGASLRYFEAVCYNKKLLTNNKYIINFPYYNPKYMKIFSDFNDIDIDWILSDEPIDYGYRGDFSPNLLINRLQSFSNDD